MLSYSLLSDQSVDSGFGLKNNSANNKQVGNR